MEMLALLAFALAAIVATFARRQHRLSLWQRELEQAFGSTDSRRIPEPRSLRPRQLTRHG